MLNTCKSNGDRELASYSSGARVSNAWIIYPILWDNISKGVLIPDKPTGAAARAGKGGDLFGLPISDESASH